MILECYRTYKNGIPDHLILIKVGDFFETFDQDARAMAEVLGLNLGTIHLKGFGDVPICGFPVACKDEYTTRLRHKFNICLCRLKEMDAHQVKAIERFNKQTLEV